MTIHVTVTLDPAAFGLPSPLPGPTFDFDLPDTGDADAEVCETVFAICNSYPEEMHCAPSHRRIVTDYRARRLRSLSVGDKVAITRGDETVTYQVAGFGFTQV